MKKKSSKKTAAQKENKRLVGWLISYGLDEEGAAYEIRTGRTFIGSKNGLDDCVITVNEGTIDAPHAAMSASAKHRIMVQDLFSDSGTFLTRSDNSKESKVSGPVELQHGDWLRLGDNTRFQLCLIDKPSR